MCLEDGVTIFYNVDGHLDGSTSSKLNIAKWRELKFADDTAIQKECSVHNNQTAESDHKCSQDQSNGSVSY